MREELKRYFPFLEERQLDLYESFGKEFCNGTRK